MSLYLALDTATDRATLALGGRGLAPREHTIADRRDLSSSIERVTADLLRAAGVAPRDLEGLCVGDGPGGFTGLRIGVAFAKGMARGLGVPLLAAPSMLGAAWSAAGGAETHVEVRYDALRGDVYRALYHIGPDGVRVLAAPALASRALPPAVGARQASEADASALGILAVVSAGGVAPVTDPASWEPVYGRPAEAEARLAARRADR